MKTYFTILIRAFVGVGGLVVLAGCSTVDSTSATSFGSAATATEQQADTSFAQINALTAPNIIANAATQPTLDPNNFYQVVPSDQITQWDNTFAAMAAYAQALTTLSSSAGSDSTATALGGLATTIQSHVQSSSLPGLSTAFVSVAGALETAKFGHDAYEVAVTTDPQIQQIVGKMADAVGSSNKTALRGTVWANYQSYVLAPLQVSYLSASAQDKVSLAKQFSTALDQRSASDLQLASLRSSILALGVAHHAIVTKSALDFTSALTTINNQLALAQKTFTEVKSAPPTK